MKVYVDFESVAPTFALKLGAWRRIVRYEAAVFALRAVESVVALISFVLKVSHDAVLSKS